MPIIAKRESNFVPAPAGTYRGVCVDVVDLGMIEETWDGIPKRTHKIRIVWQIDELMEDGRPYVASNRYTLSFDPKANLRKMIEGWTGENYTDHEAQGFDVEGMVGVSGIITITHRAGSKGGTFANVTGVAPLMKGMPRLAPTDHYTRVIDREQKAQSANPEYDEANPPPSNDDIPF